ncbi:UNVERIFIED_CONTAM: hypothetical protein GTU68_026015, partial [Idotea baltica]|nr:hypothetical protein [Idotea baltica]
DLTIVGPEAPLAEGIVDVFTQHGLRIFGPTQAAAQLEASKSYAKEVMLKAGVKTPMAEVFTDFKQAKAYVDEVGAPIVIKADGLAAGKGVVALEDCLCNEVFGNSGAKVLIEEFLDGDEASLMAIVDGTTVVPLVASQDYKRLLDADEGPNTGGMGAISPTPVLEDKRVENLVAEIFLPVLNELWNQGIKYVGFIYAGLIVDKKTSEAKVIEFNCRLGDPETQVLLMRMQSDLLKAIDAATKEKLSTVELKWAKKSACCVVASSEGYPAKVNDGKEIKGLFEPEGTKAVFHAGTATGSNGKVVSKGGRILTVAALGDNMEDAIQSAYGGMSEVSFDGMHYRRDIGKA